MANIQPIASGELGATTRSKMNQAIDRVNRVDDVVAKVDETVSGLILAIGYDNRPADARVLFTSSLTGSGKEQDPIGFGQAVTNADGTALRVTSTGGEPIVVASRVDQAVEPGLVYSARVAVRRHANTSDPLGDAVQFGLSCLNAAKQKVAERIFFEGPIATADGLISRQVTFSRDQDAEITLSETTRYVRPFVRIFGGDGVTDVVTVGALASAGLPGAKGDVGDLTPAAQAAADEIKANTGIVEASTAAAAQNRLASEAARDGTVVAAQSAGVFSAVTLAVAQTNGRAATGSGQAFHATGDDVNYVGVYRRVTDATQTEVTRYPKAKAVGDLYYAALAGGDAIIPYADPNIANSAPVNMALTAGAFSSGLPGLAVTATNTTTKFIDARALVPLIRDRDYVVELNAELVEKTASTETYGFGLAVGLEGSRKGVVYQANGGVFSLDEATLTQIATGAGVFGAASKLSASLLIRPDGSVYWTAGLQGAQTSPKLLAPANSTGPVWIVVRLQSRSVLRLRVEATDTFARQDRDDAFLAINTDVVRYPMTLTGLVTGVGSGSTVVRNTFVPVQARSKSLDVYSGALNNGALGSGVAATELGMAPQVGVEYILRATAGSVASTPAIGLGFTSATAEGRGAVYRSNGQMFVVTSPGNAVATNLTGSTAFVAGDVIEMSVILRDATAGAGVAEYKVSRNGVWSEAQVVTGIPDVSRLALFARGSGTWTNISLSSRPPKPSAAFTAGAPIVYLSPTGSDNAAGGESTPVATLAKAFSLIPRVGTIEVADGEYREAATLNFTNHEIEIRSAPNARPIFLGSDRLTVTKTAGFAQIYQAPLAAKPIGLGGLRGPAMIFEWGTPSRPVPLGEEHDLHRGQTHRLPYTEMMEAASKADLDTPSGRGKWFWETGVIYFAATDGSDATAKRYETRIRVPILINGKGRLRSVRIDTFFSSNKGFQVAEGIHWHRDDCRTLGNYHDGFGDNGNSIYAIRDEAGGCGNDGINGTVPVTTGDNRKRVTSAVYIDPWCHDNYDDPLSHHARGEGSIFGGLMEHHSNGGLEMVNGGAWAAYGTLSRKNKRGFLAGGGATPDDRNKTVFRLENCTAEDCDYNFIANTRGLILGNSCDSRRAVTAAFRGDPITGSNPAGEVRLSNCRDQGSAVVKSGNVTVQPAGTLVL